MNQFGNHHTDFVTLFNAHFLFRKHTQPNSPHLSKRDKENQEPCNPITNDIRIDVTSNVTHHVPRIQPN